MIAGVAGLAAGAMSMAAGEYVSVSSQSDTEQADIRRETFELANQPDQELAELTNIYIKRGLDATLARDVATQLTAHDALGAHSRDELGIVDHQRARPLQHDARCHRRTRRRRERAGGNVARDILGCDRDGDHVQRRPVVRGGGVDGASLAIAATGP